MKLLDNEGRLCLRTTDENSTENFKFYQGDLYIKIGSLWYKLVGVDDVGVKSLTLDQNGISL